MGKQNNRFIGRQEELKRLLRFLKDKQGGAILVAGDRGSGKTRLVDEAILVSSRDESGIADKLRSIVYSRQVVVKIPLILGLSEEGKLPTPAHYRSMLMRAIVRGLESDLLTRKYKNVDLPQRWFRALGYVQSMHRLIPYAKYSSLTRHWSHKLLLGKAPISGGADMVTAGELEMNDTVLEIELRQLLQTYSHIQEFIFVIDELDKLNDRAGASTTKVEDIVLLLKNLFSETGVHIIFIADEPTLGRITRQIKAEPFCEERTLFRDMILLNHLHPEEFEDFVRQLVGEVDEVTRLKHVASLSLITQMMPAEIRRFELQFGSDPIRMVDNQRRQLGSHDYSYGSTMQVFINHVYKEHYSEYGYYFVRVLYKALAEAGNNLLNGRVRFVNPMDYTGLLYPSESFSSEDLERGFKEGDMRDHGSLIEVPPAATLVDELNVDERVAIHRAISKLVLLLDRAGYLKLRREGTGLLFVGAFLGDGFGIENLLPDLDSYLETTTEEKEIVERVNQVGHIYLAAIGETIWAKLWPTCIEIPNLHDGRGVKVAADPALGLYWRELDEKVKQAPSEIDHSVVAKLSSILGSTATISSSKTHEIHIDYHDSKFRVLLTYDDLPTISLRDFDKTFIIYDQRPKVLMRGGSKLKQYSLGEHMNVDTLVAELAISINKFNNKQS